MMKEFANKYKGMIISVILLSLLLFQSCKIQKYLLDEEVVNRSFSENFIKKYDNPNRPEHLLIDDAIIRVTNGKQLNLNLLVYIKREDYIFISGKTLGFEVFRCQLTNDSVFFINRLNRSYFFQPYSTLNLNFKDGFDIELLQDFFYTGIYEKERPTKRHINQTYILSDSLYHTNKTFSERNFLELAYNRYAELEDLMYNSSDSNLNFRTSLLREFGQIKFIESLVFYHSKEYNFQIQLNNIKHVPYNKTSFNIGNNYNENISLF